MKTNLGYGIVRETAFGKTAAPTIILFTHHDGRLRAKPVVLRMTEFPEVTVEGVTEDKDLFPLILQLRVDPNIYLMQDGDLFQEATSLVGLN